MKHYLERPDTFRFFKGPLLVAASLLGLPALIFLRYRLGERSLPILGFYMLLMMTGALFAGVMLADIASPTPLFLVVVGAATVLGIAHRVQIALRKRRGVLIHSYWMGGSWMYLIFNRLTAFLPFHMKEATFQRFVEPLVLAFVVGLPLTAVDQVVGGFFVVSGMFLLLWEQIEHDIAYNYLLDIIDASIESDAMNEMVTSIKTPGQRVTGRTPFTRAIPTWAKESQQQWQQRAMAALDAVHNGTGD